MTDPVWRATMDVLTAVVPPALFTDRICSASSSPDGEPQPRTWQQRRIVLGLCLLGMILGPYFDDYRAAFRFGKLGFDLVEKRGPHRFKARVYLLRADGPAMDPPVRSGLESAAARFRGGQQTGDLTAAYSRNNLITHLLASGDPLAEVQPTPRRGWRSPARRSSAWSLTSSPPSSS